MGRKKNKKSGKPADTTQVLSVCAVGMVSLFVGVILWGIIDSFLIPDVTINEPVIKSVVETIEGKRSEVVFLIKNEEKRSVKVEFKVKLGFDSYRRRHSSGTKSNIYRVFQALQETTREIIVIPNGEKEVQTMLEVSPSIYEKFQVTPETKIYPRVTLEKASWEGSS